MGKSKGEEREKKLTTERKKESEAKPRKKRKRKEKKVYSTRYSQAVTHPSTNRARRCLTSMIGREPVFSTWYGRRHLTHSFTPTYTQIRQHTTPTLLPTLQRTSTPCIVPKLPSARKSHWTSKPDHSGPFLQHVHAKYQKQRSRRTEEILLISRFIRVQKQRKAPKIHSPWQKIEESGVEKKSLDSQ